MGNRQAVLQIFSQDIRSILERLNLGYENLQEIRLRVHSPLAVTWDGTEYFVKKNGEATIDPAQAHLVSGQEIAQTIEYVSGYSLYAYEEELKQGFLTVQGGHRVGVAGKVLVENGKVKTIRNISFLHIRLCHQIKGCADTVLPYLQKDGEVVSALFISSPGAGKTTMLRDVIRQISNGTGMERGLQVGVVDERNELSGSYYGVPQNDLGIRTDVLDGCPKAEGMMMLIRSMAPEVLAVDEIGTLADVQAIEQAVCCGCRVLATAHGASLEDVKKNPCLKQLCQEKRFERYIILKKGQKEGRSMEIYDAEWKRLT